MNLAKNSAPRCATPRDTCLRATATQAAGPDQLQGLLLVLTTAKPARVWCGWGIEIPLLTSIALDHTRLTSSVTVAAFHLLQQLKTWLITTHSFSRHCLFISVFLIASSVITGLGASSVRGCLPFGRSTRWSGRCVLTLDGS